MKYVSIFKRKGCWEVEKFFGIFFCKIIVVKKNIMCFLKCNE